MTESQSATVQRFVPVSSPVLGELERAAVDSVMRSGAISGFAGDRVAAFEDGFARYCDSSFGVAVSNGTTALHLALVTLGVTRDDEVLVATLTNMATFFAVLYQGAIPVPIDVEPDTWNLDPSLLESKVTSRTKAIIVVHLFGHPVDMAPVMEIAGKYGLAVIEDCAEAHGALYQGKKVGSLGTVGCFSFYANKIITTGEGGMLTTSDPELAAKARSLRSLAFGGTNKFMHTDIGYNYRLTNLQAAIGVAQLTRIDDIVRGKRRVAAYYTSRFGTSKRLQLPVEKAYARNVYWMYHMGLRGMAPGARAHVMDRLRERGVETRESFIPYNLQDTFLARGWTRAADCPVANDIGLRGFYIPSGPQLSDDDLDYVASNVIEVVEKSGE